MRLKSGRKAASGTAVKGAGAPAVGQVGWNGIYLEVPLDWNVASVAGDMGQGHLRVDGPADAHVRVKWQRVGKKPQNLKRILGRYLKEIEKKGRKAPGGFESSTDLKLNMPADVLEREPLFFSWQSETRALGLIWHCKKCGRITIAQVDAPARRNLTGQATAILSSLDDHAVEGCHTWAVYGLAAEIPADFVLTKNKLLSGFIQLAFSKGRSSAVVERWGLADVITRKSTLVDWVKAQHYKDLRSYRTTVEEAEVRGHTGVVITGSLSGLRDRARAAVLGVARMGPPTRITLIGWVCEETNRLCCVELLHTNMEEGLAEEIAASFVCHGRPE